MFSQDLKKRKRKKIAKNLKMWIKSEDRKLEEGKRQSKKKKTAN